MVEKRKMVWYTDDEAEYLGYESGFHQTERPATRPKPTAEQLAEMCDRDAEDGNRHDFCGVHAVLSKLLATTVTKTAHYRIMLEIAERGGLHGMNDD